MANPEHVEILKRGVKYWNKWRAKNPLQKPDLSFLTPEETFLDGIDLSSTDLSNTDFTGAYLANANLTHAKCSHANFTDAFLKAANLWYVDFSFANLRRARFYDAELRYATFCHACLKNTRFNDSNLSSANLSDADLEHADFHYTDLTNAKCMSANFSRADLSHCRLIGADLCRANLANSCIENTHFGDRDFRLVKGLDTAWHNGPSPLSINSIYLSNGEVSEVFVRGTGAPDIFIEYLRALASKPIEYYTCFISYSSKDQAFCDRLYADLQNNGVRCWFAPYDMKIGDRIRDRIDESIRLYDKLLLIVSEHSIMSDWVEFEVETALEKERQRKRDQTVLFPVRIDSTVLNCSISWARHLRQTRHIGNFERWKEHDEYQVALKSLLRDMKAGSNKE